MIYRNKKRAAILSLGLLLSTSACKKLIEIDPPINSINTSTVFNDPDKATAALSGIYYTLMTNSKQPSFSSGTMTVYGGMMADELVPFAGASNPIDYQFYSNKLKLDNLMVMAPFWGTAYKAVYTANAVLAGVAAATSPTMTDSIKRQLNGECHFARAYCFFYLSNLFGEIPLPLTADPLTESLQKRHPIEQVNQQILADLTAAIQLLPDNFAITQGSKVRPNKYAAIALLARHYLYNKQWKEAEEQASILINSGQFSMPAIDQAFSATSRETIWCLKFSSVSAGVDIMPETMYLMPQFSLSMIPPADREFFLDPVNFESFVIALLPNYFMTDQLVNAFESGDLRKDKWTDSLTAPNAAPWNGTQYRFVRKYERITATAEFPHPYYTVLRMAEQYLIRAEARAQQQDLSGAAADINILRSRAALPNTKAATKEALLDAIAHERQIELFGEWGHRWFDLKRTGKAAQVLGALSQKQPWSDHQLLLFIPPDEIKNDPALTQNPGYFW